MKFSNSSNFQYLKGVILIFFISLFSHSYSDPRITEAGLFCGSSRPPPNTTVVPTFVDEMEKLSELVKQNNWGQQFVNSSIPMYGLAQCHRDLSNDDCISCFAATRTRIPNCLPALSARLYLDGCFLRYDSYEFYNQSTDPSLDSVNCSSSRFEGNGDGDKKLVGFKENVGVLIDRVTADAVGNEGFGVMEVKGVFGLAQCWKSVSSDGCRECLEKAGKEVRGCLPSREGRGLNVGCYLKYSDKKFFDETGDKQGNSGSISVGAVVGIAISAAVFLVLLFLAAYILYVRSSKLKKERNNLGHVSLFNKVTSTYNYDILEKATDYFNQSRKLGEGSAGSVFKGTLPNGVTVAVKRLFFNNRQWVDELFNEVKLISGVQHKNLVKLLGCSIEGPESLLVYEYVPNKSLDQFIFDKNNVRVLNWKQRFNIIVGTAEGLAYLHSGTEMKIIHRDIKSSNIVLDENLNPKIVDFGLARGFGADKTHLSTGIAGTFGYMAPEYLLRGQLTEKADIYSFGVLVLEIVSGRKNVAFVEDSGSLLQTIWRHYRTHRLVEVIDPRLRENFPANEASKVLQIGLLCTQASPALRPSMHEVVRMLISEDCEVPVPNQPPFLRAQMGRSASLARSSGSSNLLSSGARNSSTESSSILSYELSLINR